MLPLLLYCKIYNIPLSITQRCFNAFPSLRPYFCTEIPCIGGGFLSIWVSDRWISAGLSCATEHGDLKRKWQVRTGKAIGNEWTNLYIRKGHTLLYYWPYSSACWVWERKLGHIRLSWGRNLVENLGIELKRVLELAFIHQLVLVQLQVAGHLIPHQHLMLLSMWHQAEDSKCKL